jgi:RNA polymerase sigma-70 factor, ECF subfamily
MSCRYSYLSSILQALVAGDPRAWTQFVAQHQGWLTHRARRLAANAADVDDLVQDVFFQVYRQVRGDKLTHLDQVHAWLSRLLRFVFSDRILRPQNGTRRGGRRVIAKRRLPDQPDPRSNPDLDCQRRESLGQVRAAVDQLPPRVRQAILLRYFESMSVKEVADTLGITIGSARDRLRRGQALLRSMLADDRRGERPGRGARSH